MYGYKAQCALLSEHLELLIAGCEARTQSLICEGEAGRCLRTPPPTWVIPQDDRRCQAVVLPGFSELSILV